MEALSQSVTLNAEPLTPFMPWSVEERAPLSEPATVGAPERQLLVELLREPSSIVERLLDPARLQGLVLGSVGVIAVCTSLFAATSSAARGHVESWVVPAALTSVNVLMALAASLGPIYAASILVAARVPLARLVAALLASAATGSLLLAGLAPPLYLLWRLDAEWAGPLLLIAAFLLSGAAAGARIHRLLSLMAEEVTRSALGNASAVLSTEDAYRVGILARVSWMMVAFTSGLGFWAFNALG
ncbi:hypothetical protein [Vitiosangium sp. GDMCC 1.1324]|uniref:hypothetical protein n=1 Tax=Vitiosangium sp. (strain GDMCC 1.1324) TaxID=2138576 RepID=UPI000D378F37|nr:hypothetical protein [Vitiosangium sp. GDMCC 1.1324]PTL75240.1 hypothetical protein DAT35_55880 [Vitiosangium sp. GDMCC 1.1324]